MGLLSLLIFISLGALCFGTLVLPDVAEVLILKNWLNNTAPQNAKLKLFKTNVTPAEASVAGDFTEADFTGYAAIVLAGASWSFTSGAPSHADFAKQTFTSSADQALQTIYGYYVVQETSGILMWAEVFPAPVPIINLNDKIEVTPRFEMS